MHTTEKGGKYRTLPPQANFNRLVKKCNYTTPKIGTKLRRSEIWEMTRKCFLNIYMKVFLGCYFKATVGMFDSDLVRLIRPKNRVEQNIIRTKSKNKFSSINIMFD